MMRVTTVYSRMGRPSLVSSSTNIVRSTQRGGARRTFFSFRSKSNSGGYQHQETHFRHNRDPGLKFTAVLSDPKDVEGPEGVPSRGEQIRRLEKSSQEKKVYDVLVVGAGATGAGCAMDAADRGLSVACIERGDFSSETSSRSTKLIWAGIRYMGTATAMLLSMDLLTNPIHTVQEYLSEMKLVLDCHRERRYMTIKQPHLCNWIAIAVPFESWHVSPPPFDHWLYGFFPILAPFVLKFYDSLSLFRCPSSYIMSPTRAKEVFPQLSDRQLKYCAVFYEAQHNDARTNLAIALTAAEKGAHIANYVEMIDVIREGEKVVGVRALDRMTGKVFSIFAKKVVLAGGPFTDSLRSMEEEKTGETKEAVRGAAGTHIVLPGYYCPNNMGLLDYNTSDGRFLFMLPWERHTLVGTTDTLVPAETSPSPPEDEVQWILNECSKYLSPELRVRRSDVLSAWRGWRPLANDPHAAPGAPVSREHVVSENPKTGVIFVAGGKWTTWREMSEHVIDTIVGEDGPKCKTLDVTLFGGEGYSRSLAVQLIQKYGLAEDVAEHLVKTYGGRALDVCKHAQPTNQLWPRFGVPLAPNFPYIDAEVVYACREYACTIEDVLSRRTRIAFLNKDAALSAIPRVADIMAKELGWSKQVKKQQMDSAYHYVNSYTGRIPNKADATLREATYRDFSDVFNALDTDGNGYLFKHEVGEAAAILGFPMTAKQLDKAFRQMDRDGTGRVTLETFETWWNHATDTDFHRKLTRELGLVGRRREDMKKMGEGVFFG